MCPHGRGVLLLTLLPLYPPCYANEGSCISFPVLLHITLHMASSEEALGHPLHPAVQAEALMLFAEIPGSPECPCNCMEDLAQQRSRELPASTSQAGKGCKEGVLVFQMLLPSSMVADREFPRGTTQLSCLFCSWRMGKGLLALDAGWMQLSTTCRRIINVSV